MIRDKRLAISAALLLTLARSAAPQPAPNIILIYADDLGFGDVSAYGAKTINTPNIDRLAKAGLRFTDAHSSAATCTPSRYALLTGEYAFRKPGTGVLPGNAALIIEPGRTTLPSMLRSAGYATGVVGKWHLGLGPKAGPDWNGDITPGPNDIGFDYSFIMAATGDRVPTVYVENRRVVGLDPADPITVDYSAPVDDGATGRSNPEQLKMAPSHGHDQTIVNGISRIGYMKGGKAALWKDEDMADDFTRRAVLFIEEQKTRPFFLFFALHDPHVPRVPHPRFAGKTTMGPRGDVIVETDWSVGEILDTLDRLKLADNTLVIFTSDNGPVVDDGYKDDAVAQARKSCALRPVPRREVQPFRGRNARAVHRALAGPCQAGHVGRADLAGRFPAIVRRVREEAAARWRRSGQRGHDGRPARHDEGRPRGTGRAGWRSGAARGAVEIHRGEQATQDERPDEHRAWQ